jgi:hypothetical protein
MLGMADMLIFGSFRSIAELVGAGQSGLEEPEKGHSCHIFPLAATYLIVQA